MMDVRVVGVHALVFGTLALRAGTLLRVLTIFLSWKERLI